MKNKFTFLLSILLFSIDANSISAQDIITKPEDLISKPAPELKLKDLDNHPVLLSQLKTDYVLIVFWDGDCNHCTMFLPLLDTFYRSYLKKMNCEVLGVMLDSSRKRNADFIQQHNINWLNGWDIENTSDFRKLYYVYKSPLMFLLDKDKNVIAVPFGITDLQKTLNAEVEKQEDKTETDKKITEQKKPEAEMNVYPNPFSNDFTLYLPEISDYVAISVYSMDGKFIFRENYNTTNSTLYIDVSNRNLSAGTYIVNARIGRHLYTKKIVKM